MEHVQSRARPRARGSRDERIRVLVMIDALITAGAERVAVDLACALDRERFSPFVLATRCGGPLEETLQLAGVPYAILHRRRRIAVRPWFRAWRIARMCDVIHAHKFGSNVWGALLARLARRPLIAHDHNWAGGAGRMHGWLHRWWIGPVAQRMVCVSNPVADTMRTYGIPAERTLVIHHGIAEVDPLPRARARDGLGIPEGTRAIGIVAALRPVKAHDVLLRALAILLHAHDDIMLCVIGDGTERGRLRALADELALTDAVRWIGERADAATLFTAFDVAVLCSHTEGLPLSALEAMRVSVPIVASDVGGLHDLLRDGAGVLVPPGAPDALATALGTLLDDPDEAARVGRRGHERFAREFEMRQRVIAFEALYADVVDSGVDADPRDGERRAA